jgi:proline iminopeptidase
MTEQEGYLKVPGGRVWYRSVGESTGDRAPLLCLHGGPGFTHYYLEPLEALADRRQVIFYDQLGCGRSERPDDLSLWTVERFVEEVAQVRAALGLDRLHLFGSSWGGMLAMQYVLDRQADLESLTLCGSPASMIRWVADCEELLAEEPAETRKVIREHEHAGFTACPEYQAAILGFYRKHVCRLDPWPGGLERSFAEAGYQVYNTMNGPSEFTVTWARSRCRPCWSAAVTTSAPPATWPPCTSASAAPSCGSSRTPPTCASLNSPPNSPRSSTHFLT